MILDVEPEEIVNYCITVSILVFLRMKKGLQITASVERGWFKTRSYHKAVLRASLRIGRGS